MDEKAMKMVKEFEQGFSGHLGIIAEEVGDGYAKGTMVVTDKMLNFHGSAHGGSIFSLADTIFGLAGNYHGTAVALQVSMNYMKPVFAGEKLTAEAFEEGLTRSTGTYSVTITNDKGEKIAVFRGTTYRLGKNFERKVVTSNNKENKNKDKEK